MHTESSIVIHAPLARVFALGANIGDWPAILPHYRWVTVFADDGRVKQAEMAARRGRIPVKWRTAQVVVPEESRIVFLHTGGVTRGMYVEWRLRELPAADGSGVSVTIAHDLAYPVRPLTDWFARYVVGEFFVEAIAGRTLATIKALAETSAEVPAGPLREAAPAAAA